MPNTEETNGDAAAGTGNSSSAMTNTSSDPVDVIIDKLLSVRGARPGKQVDMSEAEIKMLCVRVGKF